MTLINKARVKRFIKDHSKYITQVECTFYSALESRVERMILEAIATNLHRKRLTQYELLGNSKFKGGDMNDKKEGQ